MIAFVKSLPGRIIAAVPEPLAWTVAGVLLAAAVVLGGIQVHLIRAERQERRRNATRYDTEE